MAPRVVDLARYENNYENKQNSKIAIFHMALMATGWVSPKRQKESSKHTHRKDVHHSHKSRSEDYTKPNATREYCLLWWEE